MNIVNSNNRLIYVSTACLQEPQSLISRVSLYRSYGLNAIELGTGVYATKEDLYQIAKMKCHFLLHNYFPPPPASFVINLASSDECIRQQSLDHVFKAIALSADLGASFYSVHAGFITDPISFGKTSFVFPAPASPDEERFAMDRFTTALEIAVDRAKQLGVRLLLENNVCPHGLRESVLLQTADEFMALFPVLRSSHLGMLLDTGHLNVTAHTLGFNRMAFVEKVAPYVQALHVHDNNGTADTHQPVQPGSWVLDLLRRPEFTDLPFVVEAKFEMAVDLCRHVDWLKTELGCE